jgi:5-methylcytosine-specific restriction endonuclease McrA
MKTCSKCKEEKPATSEYFTLDRRKRYGLASECRPCKNKRMSNWVKNNPEKQNKRVKDWARRNPEKARHIWRKIASRRKAKIKGNGWEPYTEEQMLSKYGSICYLCNEEIDLQAPRKCGRPGWEKGLQKDHVIAIDNNGPDTLDNVRPTHGKCNHRKSNKEIYETA